MPNDHPRVQAVFLEAAELPLSARAALLDCACGTDAELRRRVEALLKAHDAPGSFLMKPAFDLADTADSGSVHDTGEKQAALTQGEAVGALVGPYRLVHALGEGGMGTVWMAEQTHPVQRLVALKVIKPGMDSRQVVA